MPARPSQAPFPLALAAGPHGAAATPDNILAGHRAFHLQRHEAKEIFAEVDGATRDWRRVFSRCGVAAAHIDEFAWSFEGFRQRVSEVAALDSDREVG